MLNSLTIPCQLLNYLIFLGFPCFPENWSTWVLSFHVTFWNNFRVKNETASSVNERLEKLPSNFRGESFWVVNCTDTATLASKLTNSYQLWCTMQQRTVQIIFPFILQQWRLSGESVRRLSPLLHLRINHHHSDNEIATLFDSMKKFQVFNMVISQAAEKFIANFLKLFKISINFTLSWNIYTATWRPTFKSVRISFWLHQYSQSLHTHKHTYTRLTALSHYTKRTNNNNNNNNNDRLTAFDPGQPG